MIKCDVIVTGAAGFIGGYLCDYLAQRGVKILGIDKRDAKTGYAFLRHDLTAPLAERIEARACVHLASAVGGILYNSSDQADIERYNAAVNAGVTDICRRGGCAQLVFFSSINVFESDPVFTHAPVRTPPALTPYAKSKAQAERAFAQEFANFVALRPTNVFGRDQARTHERVGESHVIPDLMKKIRENDVVQVLGDGTQLRNFVHVLDIATFTEKVLAYSGQAYFNLRSDLTITIAALAAQLARFLQRDVAFQFEPSYMRLETFRIRNFDLAPASSMGWAPEIHSIAEGLRL